MTRSFVIERVERMVRCLEKPTTRAELQRNIAGIANFEPWEGIP